MELVVALTLEPEEVRENTNILKTAFIGILQHIPNITSMQAWVPEPLTKLNCVIQ
ncbi:hypothetical protein HanIR_Chr10g0452821 [Helianthus annuus]|nr:hypothetical protein HanIR_Chr11g0550671 [Helianthus annuus]KAJ0519847.1 hypothetical protein HanIR_Chr10g0452821 [Helianthus annuus]